LKRKENVLMGGVRSNEEEFRKLAESKNDEPFVMLNLLRFRKGGADSYARYMEGANKHVAAVGGKMIYLGKANELLNGDTRWDLVMLVKYPSRKAFLKMANDPDYLEVHKYREDAVEDAVLYATDEIHYRQFLSDTE